MHWKCHIFCTKCEEGDRGREPTGPLVCSCSKFNSKLDCLPIFLPCSSARFKFLLHWTADITRRTHLTLHRDIQFRFHHSSSINMAEKRKHFIFANVLVCCLTLGDCMQWMGICRHNGGCGWGCSWWSKVSNQQSCWEFEFSMKTSESK